MVDMTASVNLPLYHKIQKFSSGTGSPGWSRKMVVVVLVVVVVVTLCSAIQMNFYRKIRTNKQTRNSYTRICVPMPSVRDGHHQEQRMSDRPDSDNTCKLLLKHLFHHVTEPHYDEY